MQRGDYDVSLALRPLFRAMDVVVKGSLPARVRAMYGFAWTSRERLSFPAVVAGTRALYRRPPRPAPRPLAPVVKGRNGELFKLVARAERRQLARGRLSMPEVAARLG